MAIGYIRVLEEFTIIYLNTRECDIRKKKTSELPVSFRYVSFPKLSKRISLKVNMACMVAQVSFLISYKTQMLEFRKYFDSLWMTWNAWNWTCFRKSSMYAPQSRFICLCESLWMALGVWVSFQHGHTFWALYMFITDWRLPLLSLAL